ncbi:MAG TPA: tetratricopeptide repeat protein [Gemmataceae bacterium]|nr:tetratricopeptide repeat protein [Gemmataceae bacterium]
MKKQLFACLFVVGFLPLVVAAPAPPTLKKARELWLRGNYGEAREMFETLAKDAKLRPTATIGLSRALESEGEYDKALAAVEAALKDNTKDAGLLARQAELLYLRGRWDEAEKAANAAIDASKDQFLARWIRAQIYRDRGDMKKADAECKWFVRTYSQRDEKDDPIKDPEQLVLVGLAGAENARWNNLPDQFEFILNDVYKDAFKYDKLYWPAEYQAGMLLLEKYNRPEALRAFDNALKVNVSAAEAIAAKGMLALTKMEIKEAERFAEQVLNINPKLPEALRLRADVHLATENTAAALKELETARKVNPRDERTLGRMAACLVLQKKKDELAALTKEVEKFDPKPAAFYFAMGERLDERRYFDEAEKCFEKATALRPNVSDALNSLGQLYMRMGREKEARTTLDKAFQLDKFNVRVQNLRKVLRHLDKYETLKTDHFELRYDPKHDAALAHYMAPYLETIYADLAAKFNYRPKGPILIEVFNSHQMFSGRIVALPDLHTIGACTGKMFAMASPNSRDLGKPFNWGRVLRHEMVHIFNLEQTRFLVPHWLTEGLAVNNEGFPRLPQWNELLLERVPSGKLLNLDNIELGFIRPRGRDEWNMAYCQSQLYVNYIKDKYGAAAIGAMLAAYRDGLRTTEVIQRTCKVEKETFEKGYRDYLKETIKPLQRGKPEAKQRTMAELKKAYEKDNDVDAGAELALLYLRHDRVQARKIAEDVRDRKKNQPKALYVLARLERLAGNVKRERTLLEEALNKDDPEPLVLLALGKIYYDASEFDQAAQMFELGRKVEPFKPEWLKQLARVHAQKDDMAKLIAVLKDLVPTDADDLEQRLRLARLLLENGQAAEAEKYARQAMEIDVRGKEGQKLLLKALEEQKKDAEADKLRRLFGDK